MRYIFIDIETTNKHLDFEIDKSELIEIGAIDLESNNKFSCCVKVDYPLSEFTKRLTGITDDDIKQSESSDIAIEKFLDFLGDPSDLVIIGHNIEGFDIPVLSKYSNFFSRVKYLDTLQLFQLFYPGVEQYSVEYLYRFFFKDEHYTENHRALQDAIDESTLFKEYINHKAIEKHWNNNNKDIDFLELLRIANKKVLQKQTQNQLSEIKDRKGNEQRSKFMENNYIYSYIEDNILQKEKNDIETNYFIGTSLSKKKVLKDFFKYFDNTYYKNKKYQYSDTIERTSDEELEKIYKDCLGNKSPRESQFTIIKRINNLFSGEEKKHTIGIEAETGIGKTYGYLIPTMNFLQKNDQYKVFLSTYTKVLQEQIMKEDISTLGKKFNNVKFCHLKANSEAFDLNEIPFSGKRITLYHIILLVWIQREHYYYSDIHYGIIAKLNHFQNTPYIYNSISITPSGTDYNTEYGFKGLLKKQIAENNLFVVNHNFLLSQFGGVSKEPITGYFNIIGKNQKFRYFTLLDEGHNIEHIMRETFTLNYDVKTFKELINSLVPGGKINIFGLIKKDLKSIISNVEKTHKQNKSKRERIETFLSENEILNKIITLIESKDMEEKIKDCYDYIPLIIDNFQTTDLYEIAKRDINELRKKYSINSIAYEKKNLYTYYIQSQEETVFEKGLKKLLYIYNDIYTKYNNIIKKLQELFRELESETLVKDILYSSLLSNIKSIVIYLEQGKQFLETFKSGDNFIEVSIDFRENKLAIENFGFKMIKKDIYKYGNIFKESQGNCLLSATLADNTEGKSYILQEIIGDKEKYLQYPSIKSPFDYQNNRRIIVPEMNIDDDSEIIFQKKAQLVLEYIKKYDGKTLILTTNNNDKDKIANFLYNHLNKEGIMIKKHESGSMNSKSNKNNIQSMIDNPRTVLIGSKSYMEGVDIPGKNLSLVVLWKLPFLPPSPFITYQDNKPEYKTIDNKYVYHFLCGVVFRQAIGRLIRSETDKGEILILDPRIKDNSGYFFKEYIREENIYTK